MSENMHISYLPEVITLMYHRIDDTNTDPWNICVSRNNFKEQIKFLKDDFNIISSADLIEQLTTNSVSQNNICITFDDGYADNYFNAKPILEQYNCPAAFFIATAFVNQNKPYWWDELEMILLHSKNLPAHLSLYINGNNYEYVLEAALSQQQYLQHTKWRWYETPPTKRCEVFLNIWEKLRPLSYHEIDAIMNELKNWSETDTTNQRLPMNENQLRELAANDLFTICMHTHTHIDLKEKQKNIQVEEIFTSQQMLNTKWNIKSNCLAYPYGRYDDVTIEAVKHLHIAGCFTTNAISINAASNESCLGRYQVCDWDVETFKNYIDAWRRK